MEEAMGSNDEFLVLTHVLQSPHDITDERSAPRRGSSLVVHNEYYRKHGAPRRDQLSWPRTLITFPNYFHNAIPFRETLQGEDEGFLILAFDGETSIWNTRKQLQNITGFPVTCMPEPQDDFTGYLQRRSDVRSQLYAAGGDFRATQFYQALLDERLFRLETASALGRVTDICRGVEHVERYFALRDLVRRCAWKLEVDAELYTKDAVRAFTAAIRERYIAASSRKA